MNSIMKFSTKQIGVNLIIAALMIVSLAGCKKDDPEAPLLPPSSSFVMDYSEFDDNSFKSASTAANFVFAGTHVAVWNTVLFFNLVVPVAAFWESFNHQAEYQGNSTWTWDYNFNVIGIQHKAELQAVLDGAEVQWKMYISKDGNYSNYLWYSGSTRVDRTYANWTLNSDPANPQQYLNVEWNRNAQTGLENIKYKNVIPGHADNGSYIYYEQSNDADLDRVYDIYGSGNDNLINIKWHHLNKDGRVKNEAHFGDTDWHCWDIDYTDMVCQ